MIRNINATYCKSHECNLMIKIWALQSCKITVGMSYWWEDSMIMVSHSIYLVSFLIATFRKRQFLFYPCTWCHRRWWWWTWTQRRHQLRPGNARCRVWKKDRIYVCIHTINFNISAKSGAKIFISLNKSCQCRRNPIGLFSRVGFFYSPIVKVE